LGSQFRDTEVAVLLRVEGGQRSKTNHEEMETREGNYVKRVDLMMSVIDPFLFVSMSCSYPC
jgi:hypothetical protein